MAKMVNYYTRANVNICPSIVQDKFVREIRRAKINDATLKEIGMWLNLAYAKLQRNGPLLTAEVHEYLSQKKEEGPIYVEGMEEYLSKVKSAVLSNPK